MKSSAMAATSLILPFSAKARAHKIKSAILGTGSWGINVLLKSPLTSDQFEIIALCDINSIALNNVSDEVVKSVAKKPKLFSPYLEFYELSGLEAVAIVTHTQWHSLQFIDACEKGHHVFPEEPICYNIREG